MLGDPIKTISILYNTLFLNMYSIPFTKHVTYNYNKKCQQSVVRVKENQLIRKLD